MGKFKKLFLHSWIRYVVALVIGIIFVLINLFVKKSFSQLINYLDGFFIGGFVLICVGGLSVVSYYGGFDIFSYNFMKKKTDSHSLYEYSQKRIEKRNDSPLYFMPYFVVGAFFLLISFILLVIYYNI